MSVLAFNLALFVVFTITTLVLRASSRRMSQRKLHEQDLYEIKMIGSDTSNRNFMTSKQLNNEDAEKIKTIIDNEVNILIISAPQRERTERWYWVFLGFTLSTLLNIVVNIISNRIDAAIFG